MLTTAEAWKDKFHIINDFPKKGISFKDIIPLLLDPTEFNSVLDELYEQHRFLGINKVCGIESRGFIFGAALANKLNGRSSQGSLSSNSHSFIQFEY